MTFDDVGELAGDLASLPAVGFAGGLTVPDWLKRPAVAGGIVAGLVGWFFGGPWAAVALVGIGWLAVRTFRDQVGI